MQPAKPQMVGVWTNIVQNLFSRAVYQTLIKNQKMSVEKRKNVTFARIILA